MADIEAFLGAAFRGDAVSLEACLDRGMAVNSRGQNGHMALPLACAEGHVECVRTLMRAGGDVSACDMEHSPLFAAVRGGHADCASILLAHGAQVETGSGVGDGYSPLQVASALGHSSCVALLLAHGACADRACDGVTALHSASWQNHAEVVRLLIDARASIGASDASGTTALHLSAKFGHAASTVALVAGGAPLGECDALGASPLHLAIERGHHAVARILFTAMAQQVAGVAGGEQAAARGGVARVLDSLDAIARSELTVACAPDLLPCRDHACDTATCGWNTAVRAVAAPLLQSGRVVSERRERVERVEGEALPCEFAAQADAMPLYLRRLLVDNAPPEAACIGSIVRALRLPPHELSTVCTALTAPRRSLLLRVERCLDAEPCAALRKAVDSDERSTGEDSVDGLSEHQLDCTVTTLSALIGEESVERLRGLPARFADSRCGEPSPAGATSSAPLPDPSSTAPPTVGPSEDVLRRVVIQRAFVRRYAARERPWFTLHMDTAVLTANIALADDRLHEGGRLLALVGADGLFALERAQGEATVHPSSLLHGVTSMRGDAPRHSLIIFYRLPEDEGEDTEPWRGIP